MKTLDLTPYAPCPGPSKLIRRNFLNLAFFLNEYFASALPFFKSSLRHISIGPLNGLHHLHSRPINLIFFEVSYKIALERSHLKAGFTLRCFQRLSFPDVATQLYPWRDNWYTIGPSTPVLSY